MTASASGWRRVAARSGEAGSHTGPQRAAGQRAWLHCPADSVQPATCWQQSLPPSSSAACSGLHVVWLLPHGTSFRGADGLPVVHAIVQDGGVVVQLLLVEHCLVVVLWRSGGGGGRESAIVCGCVQCKERRRT